MVSVFCVLSCVRSCGGRALVMSIIEHLLEKAFVFLGIWSRILLRTKWRAGGVETTSGGMKILFSARMTHVLHKSCDHIGKRVQYFCRRSFSFDKLETPRLMIRTRHNVHGLGRKSAPDEATWFQHARPYFVWIRAVSNGTCLFLNSPRRNCDLIRIIAIDFPCDGHSWDDSYHGKWTAGSNWYFPPNSRRSDHIAEGIITWPKLKMSVFVAPSFSCGIVIYCPRNIFRKDLYELRVELGSAIVIRSWLHFCIVVRLPNYFGFSMGTKM